MPPLENVSVADEAGPSSAKRAGSPSVVGSQPEGKRAKQDAASSNDKPMVAKKQKRDLNFHEEPFSYVDPSKQEVKNIA